MSRPQGHSAVGRITSNEKPNNLIENRTRDLPAFRIVPQPTTLPRAPTYYLSLNILRIDKLEDLVTDVEDNVRGF
jgi:hypothetical protein